MVAINLACIFILMSLLVVYGLSMSTPYPRMIIEQFQYPHIRLFTYLSLYALSYMNPIVALLAFMIVLFLHLDFVNLTKPLQKNPSVK